MTYDGSAQPPCFAMADEVRGMLAVTYVKAVKITVDDRIRVRILNIKVDSRQIVRLQRLRSHARRQQPPLRATTWVPDMLHCSHYAGLLGDDSAQ